MCCGLFLYYVGECYVLVGRGGGGAVCMCVVVGGVVGLEMCVKEKKWPVGGGGGGVSDHICNMLYDHLFIEP